SVFLASGGGIGFIPMAPGTFGTLEGWLLFWILRHYFGFSVLFWLVVILYLAGIVICDLAAKQSGVKDPSFVIWDEMICFMLVLLFTPSLWIWQLVALALFRFFDILKPGWIGLADKKLQGGFGIMFDDFLASISSIVVVFVLFRFFARV
ncbi:MAG: phosphatidylglycerophosphatase A, partial [Pseudomonadota bacterium]|nr:phosphatidylglycerophosphatase A [Pseudomonadota bacterium]